MSTPVETPNLPACRPVCPSSPDHGVMTYRPGATREQEWCGTWYRCEWCTSSVLLPSPALLAHLDEQQRAAEARR